MIRQTDKSEAEAAAAKKVDIPKSFPHLSSTFTQKFPFFLFPPFIFTFLSHIKKIYIKIFLAEIFSILSSPHRRAGFFPSRIHSPRAHSRRLVLLLVKWKRNFRRIHRSFHFASLRERNAKLDFHFVPLAAL